MRLLWWCDIHSLEKPSECNVLTCCPWSIIYLPTPHYVSDNGVSCFCYAMFRAVAELSMSVYTHTAYMTRQLKYLIVEINPSKLSWWNMNIYLHLISLPQTAMMPIIEIIIHERKAPVYPYTQCHGYWCHPVLRGYFSSSIWRVRHTRLMSEIVATLESLSQIIHHVAT